MYWNNPLIETLWPGNQDPIRDSLHNGQHCLFWDPQGNFKQCKTNQTLTQLCDWANSWLIHDGIDGFVADAKNHYDIANLVKINMWIKDIRQQGIVKPWLFLHEPDGSWTTGTGESRMRCLERIPEISSVPAFICTTADRAHEFGHLEPVTNLDKFAMLCGARQGQLFLFRLTDPSAPYGLYWYEYNSDLTRKVMPSEAACIKAFVEYCRLNPALITPEWFDQDIEWSLV